jgi:hypothetical protein
MGESDEKPEIGLLKRLALFPYKHSTWLGLALSVPNANPPASFSPDTRFVGTKGRHSAEEKVLGILK